MAGSAHPGPSFDIEFPYLYMRSSGLFDPLWSNSSEDLKRQSVWNLELPERFGLEWKILSGNVEG